MLLLRAAPEWHDGAEAFEAELDGARVPVTVAKCPTVLAVLAALTADREDGRYLVVLTPQETADLGDSVSPGRCCPGSSRSTGGTWCSTYSVPGCSTRR